MAHLEEAGEPERAIETGTRILGFEPLHEVAARRLMRLYGRSGRRGAAMAVYHSLAATLRREVGAEPEDETRALFAALSRGTEASIAPRFSTGCNLKPPHEAVPRADEAARPLKLVHILSSIAVASGRSSYKLVGIVGAILLAAGLAMFSGRQFLSPSHVTGTQGADATNAWTSVSRDAVTIAVLPFANLSGDASQEFFSDGMTEEINTALAKVPGLNVIARTSAFAFKGQNIDARTVGPMLGASHLIEGSVRKAGQRVRIAAQLVRSNDGVQLWSQSYERDLTDIFAVQEEIATSIIGSLRVPLGLSQNENLVNNRSIDPDSYERYLRGKSLFLARAVPARYPRSESYGSSLAVGRRRCKEPDLCACLVVFGGDLFRPRCTEHHHGRQCRGTCSGQ